MLMKSTGRKPTSWPLNTLKAQGLLNSSTNFCIEEFHCSFCNREPEKLLHLFWSCPKVASFWHSLTAKLTLLHITPEHYTLDILVALGLKPDSSINSQQINLLYLLARNYIWISKRNETAPKLLVFLQYLKSFYEIETNAGTTHQKSGKNKGLFFSNPLILYTSVYPDPLYMFLRH